MSSKTPSAKPELSIVIPVYNEALRIDNLKKVLAYVEKVAWPVEVIVVDDGSTDETAELLREWQQKYGFVLLQYAQNRGKGYAIAHGMKRARGKWHLFFDIDLSVPITTLKELWPILPSSPVVIGTRRHPDSRIITPQPRSREVLGRFFTFFSQIWLQTFVSDFTCGFKAFSAEASKDLFPRLQLQRWGFDAELLFLAKKRGWAITELPVTWSNDDRTKVKFPQDIIRSVYELAAVRYFELLGRYK